MKTRKIVVGVTGASGFIYAVELLMLLRSLEMETHLVVSKAAHLTRSTETDLSSGDVESLASVVYSPQDFGAAIASGSFRSIGMIVAPCSMKTLAEIAGGNGSTLIARAADVMLKERRRLVLMVRETPLHLGHLQNMVKATTLGAIVSPASPAFYHRPASLEEAVRYTVGRVLDLFELDVPLRRWKG